MKNGINGIFLLLFKLPTLIPVLARIDFRILISVFTALNDLAPNYMTYLLAPNVP